MSKIKRLMVALASAALAACGGGDSDPVTQNPTRAEVWQIGPIIKGKNYSVGLPLRPTQAEQGWYIDLPHPTAEQGHAHYVTFRHGPLAGKQRLVMRFRLEAEPGVKILPRNFPEYQSSLTLYFQRKGDSWDADDGDQQFYRWYAYSKTVIPLVPGEYEVTANFSEPWTSVWGKNSPEYPGQFQRALQQTDRVGFVMGGGDGLGHGVYATGPARLTVLEYRVE